MIKHIARAKNKVAANEQPKAEVMVAPEQPKVEVVPTEVVPVVPTEEPKAKRKLSDNAKASRAANDGKAYPADWVVTKVNPTKYSKGRLDRYNLHAVGQTVGAYLAKAKEKAGWSHASSQADLRWDVAKGHIVIEAPKAS